MGVGHDEAGLLAVFSSPSRCKVSLGSQFEDQSDVVPVQDGNSGLEVLDLGRVHEVKLAEQNKVYLVSNERN